MLFPTTNYQPQSDPTRRPWFFWVIVAVVTLTFVSLIFVAPLAANANHQTIAQGIYRPFASLCHQMPERSFFIAGHKLAVCARCTGLYLGFSLIMLLYPIIRPVQATSAPQRKWLLMAAIPMAIDFSLTFFGLWENTHTSRFLTGFLLGGVAVIYVMPGVAELSLRGVEKADPMMLPSFTLSSAEAIAAAPSDYSAPQRRI
jgi:uncharacterized membrane protein